MNVFETIRDKVMSLFDNSGWVKWIHEGTTPAYTQTDKEWNLVYGAISKHCAKCLNLNGCCFPSSNTPEPPLHPKCHCWLMPVSNLKFTAKCRDSKFTTNIFNPTTPNGKKTLLEELGYDIMDSDLLIKEFCRQAKDKYSKGEFILNKLDDYGQRINIAIVVSSKDGKTTYTINSGWMVYPDGEINLVTVYGGKNK